GRFEGTVNFNPGGAVANMAAAGGQDVFLAKYNTTGTYAWALAMGGAGADGAWGIRTDGTYAIYVTGDFQQSADFDPHPSRTAVLTASGNTDAFVAKYNLCIPADTAVPVASRDTICFGENTTLTVTAASLRHADHWEWSLNS